jgi:hypothetical protein
MVDLGIEIPAGHALVSYAERPDLVEPAGYFNGSAWPEFMHHDEIVHRYWHLLDDAWPEFQLVLLDADGAIAATNNSAPIAWDGTDDGLPDGWDRQLERSAEQHATGVAPDTLGAIQIVVDPDRRGTRLAGVMVNAMRADPPTSIASRSSPSRTTPSGPAPTANPSMPGSGCMLGSAPASSGVRHGR